MSVNVRVLNREKLAAKLKRLAPEVQRALGEANERAATEMVASARNLAPVGLTGNLVASIRAEFVGRETGAVRVSAGGATTTKHARGGQGSYDYALGVEFGTSDTTAVPFFFPAFRLVKRRHRGRTTRAINQAHKRVASK
jgi:HK97 gp10 family phage protein